MGLEEEIVRLEDEIAYLVRMGEEHDRWSADVADAIRGLGWVAFTLAVEARELGEPFRMGEAFGVRRAGLMLEAVMRGDHGDP